MSKIKSVVYVALIIICILLSISAVYKYSDMIFVDNYGWQLEDVVLNGINAENSIADLRYVAENIGSVDFDEYSNKFIDNVLDNMQGGYGRYQLNSCFYLTNGSNYSDSIKYFTISERININESSGTICFMVDGENHEYLFHRELVNNKIILYIRDNDFEKWQYKSYETNQQILGIDVIGEVLKIRNEDSEWFPIQEASQSIVVSNIKDEKDARYMKAYFKDMVPSSIYRPVTSDELYVQFWTDVISELLNKDYSLSESDKLYYEFEDLNSVFAIVPEYVKESAVDVKVFDVNPMVEKNE